MTLQIPPTTLRTFRSFLESRQKGVYPNLSQILDHVYIKLDFHDRFERATTGEDAKDFLRSVTRAGWLADRIAENYGGALIELQGSLLHVAIPAGSFREAASHAVAYAADVHAAYRRVFFDNTKRVRSWVITADSGKTFIVASPDIHGDQSWVSLGNAANAPAKHLYAQLEKSEEYRDLQKFHAAFRLPDKTWTHRKLDDLARTLNESQEDSLAAEARTFEPRIVFNEGAPSWKRAMARAQPIGPAGSSMSPSAEKPIAYWGWAMRTDLDGFTKRVEECFDNDIELQQLALQFNCIMLAGARFATQQAQSIVQLPWAGDNFTAVAVFGTKAEYDLAAPFRLVDLSIDFEKEMDEAASECGFGGWAHGVAGGELHGNCAGNVYLAGIEIRNRRFLVAVGEGIGRSAEAFGNVDPHAGEMALYTADYERLDPLYRRQFTAATTVRGETSTLYKTAKIEDLKDARDKKETVGESATITVSERQTRQIEPKPYFHE